MSQSKNISKSVSSDATEVSPGGKWQGLGGWKWTIRKQDLWHLAKATIHLTPSGWGSDPHQIRHKVSFGLPSPIPAPTRGGPRLFHHQERQVTGLAASCPPSGSQGLVPQPKDAFQSEEHPPGLSELSVPKGGLLPPPVCSICHSLFRSFSMRLR